MNKLRGLVFLVWMYGLILIIGLALLPVLILPMRWARSALDIWLALVFFGVRVILGIRLEFTGQENIPAGGVLIASKHQSMLDVLVPWRLFSFPALILKQELSWLPVFGWYVLKLKNVAIDRKAGAKALRKMLRQSAALAKQGRQILIFPEGTRVEPGQKVPYKSGVAALYLKMQVPCVPIALNTGLCWPAHGLDFKPGTVQVQILPAIAPGLDKKTFLAELETRIETATNQLIALKPTDK
ncbi:Acyl-CoA:1-acyl-sn-glycerol-3-phosphate acyltransferase [hydrothermal vent metagenome]|uniref:Acyl-CoA:1-acyl-sn-glycerol-3-phosphate acyltransferase n=1 Tax=hydrothermal vent metagenome TaxID=652676 RepID=A0A3B0RR83_9ZZZZ